MDGLKSFNLDKLYDRLHLPDADFIKSLQSIGLSHKRRTCPECDSPMSLQKPEKNQNYGKWRCPKNSCRKKKGFLKDTWFEHTDLTLKEVCLFILDLHFSVKHFKLSYLWARKMCKQDDMQFEFRREECNNKCWTRHNIELFK